MTPRQRNMSLFIAVGCVALAIGYGLARVRAEGASDALWYSGVVSDAAGKLHEGNHKVSLRLFSQISGPDPALCPVGPVDTPFVDGRFRIDAAKCRTVFAEHQEVYVELSIDDESNPLPRVRVGAVPYALEASHASGASRAMRLGPARAAKDEITVDESGKVGIGVEKPAGRLHVDGQIVATPNVVRAAIDENVTITSSVFTDVKGLAVRLTTHGGPVLLTANVNFNGVALPEAPFPQVRRIWGRISIRRDQTNLAPGGLQVAETQFDSGNQAASIVFVDHPPAGTYTYALQALLAEGGGLMIGEGGQTTQISATELN